MITLSSSTNVLIRMVRVSADETVTKLLAQLFQSFTEIIDEK